MRKLTTTLVALAISVGLQTTALADASADALFAELQLQISNGRSTISRLPQVYLIKGLFDLVGGSIGIVTWTGSMVPCLNYNDLIISLPVKVEDLKVGDIIVYRGTVGGAPGLIVHRVIKKELDGYAIRVKGDANKEPDNILIKQDILVGRVRYVVQNSTNQIRDFSKDSFGAVTSYKSIAASAELADNTGREALYIER